MEEKKKKDKKPIIIIILIIVLGVLIYVYNADGISLNSTASENTTKNNSSGSTTTTEEVNVEMRTIEKTISSSGEISSALNEKLALHATYYFSEIYFSEGDYVEEGKNILQYTNGTYMTAPYNLVIKSVSIPSENAVCKNSHYIEVYSLDSLSIELKVLEKNLSDIKIGQEVKIKLTSDETKEYTGYITKINNSGTYSSNGTTYAATVTFENDGNIKIGMSGTANIILEKAENVLVLPAEAVTTTNGITYVTKIENENAKKI